MTATNNELSRELLRQWLQGDRAAADELFQRYFTRLVALARRRIAPSLARRIDGEDVVQSAYRSFFIHARDGRFVLERSGDLWRLLVAITLHKLGHQVERQTARRRDARRDESLRATEASPAAVQLFSAEPRPEDAASVVEQLQKVMQKLSREQRAALEQRLQGASIAEIAGRQGRSQRTVRRWLLEAEWIMEKSLELPTDGQPRRSGD